MVEVSYLLMANDRRQLLSTSQVFIMKSTCTVTCRSAVPLTILLMCWVMIQLSWRPALNPHTDTVTLQTLLLAWTHCKEENNHCLNPRVCPFSITTVVWTNGHSHNYPMNNCDILAVFICWWFGQNLSHSHAFSLSDSWSIDFAYSQWEDLRMRSSQVYFSVYKTFLNVKQHLYGTPAAVCSLYNNLHWC